MSGEAGGALSSNSADGVVFDTSGGACSSAAFTSACCSADWAWSLEGAGVGSRGAGSRGGGLFELPLKPARRSSMPSEVS